MTIVIFRLSAEVPDIIYPRLANQARVNGDVNLRMTEKGPQVLSGHPLLAPAAREHYRLLKPSPGGLAAYHFEIVARPALELEVKRGNAISRVLLWLARRKSVRLEIRPTCDDSSLEDVVDRPHPTRIERKESLTQVWVSTYEACVSKQFAMLVGKSTRAN